MPLVHSKGPRRHQRRGSVEVGQRHKLGPQAAGVLAHQRQDVLLKILAGGLPASAANRKAALSAAAGVLVDRRQGALLLIRSISPVGLHPAVQLRARQQRQLAVAPEERQVLSGRARLEVAVPGFGQFEKEKTSSVSVGHQHMPRAGLEVAEPGFGKIARHGPRLGLDASSLPA